MQVNCASQYAGSIDHDELRHSWRCFHRGDAIDGQSVRFDRARRACHRVHNGALQIGLALSNEAAQVAVGKDANDRMCIIGDDRHAHALAAHFHDGIGNRGRWTNGWNCVPCPHHIGHARKQAPAEGAAWMRSCEVVDGKAARIEQCEGESVAKRERSGRARRWSEAERTCLRIDSGIEMYVGRAC